ncbi:MAG: DnaD domain protein [Bacilli bacterium]|nr:DnaD domain protein [Bacilli bacterium]
MKSSKLIDIFKDGNIVIPIYIFKNYKKLSINMDEFVFLMYLYNLGNNFLFDLNKFSNDLGIDTKDILNYVSSLTDKKLIKVEVLKNDKNVMEEVVILDDFYEKIAYFTIDDINNTPSDDSNIFQLIEKEFGKTLSPMEMEIIKAWLESNISEDLIKEALKEATFNGVSNLRYIDKILYEWGRKGVKTVEDVEKIRKSRNKSEDNDVVIDTEIFDWNWLDEEE